ncbi:MAG TPA: hypothetical protein VGR78_08135 [Verrucomicrobiae bacterium]|nr:hypothetical protein [Verrucomicrobiae bacterium]
MTLALLVLVLAAPVRVIGQSDNFDSYSNTSQFTAAGWKLSALSPALVTTTFPAIGNGKGLRIQANPVPGSAPAVGLWYRTNIYSDFYVAMDIVDWPGTDKNQAVVLFGRLTDSSGNLPPNLNPADAQGIICNYDASQYGENSGDRRQGQFQINTVSPGFVTVTLAVAEITFVPGRSYRIILQGQGSTFKAQAYDLYDLTEPLVTLTADDSAYASGACGFLGFSRQGNTGTVDATLDSYYAGVTDPNAAPPPALSHPIPETPQVVTRTPTNRFTNLHPAPSGINFTASTFSTNAINASATKLYLNDVDVSSSLAPFPSNGPSLTFSTAAGTLAPNTLYSARIELQDAGGTRKSTNTFWFDTFSDAYLTNSAVKTIEAEDYNYDGGQFQGEPIPVSGLTAAMAPVNGNGVGYFDLQGMPEIDYHDSGTQNGSGLSADYRSLDYVGTQQGEAEVQDGSGLLLSNDTQRSQYAAVDLPEYQVRRFDPGEWMNYTRVFSASNYYAYLRAGTFGATTVELDSVTSDASQTNQTTKALGIFAAPNLFMRSNYRYIPLTDASGKPVVLSLSGTNTLRLTNVGTPGEDVRKINLNYILFVPANAAVGNGIALESASVVTGPFSNAQGALADLVNKSITVPLAGNVAFYRIRAVSSVHITNLRLSGQTAVITYE